MTNEVSEGLADLMAACRERCETALTRWLPEAGIQPGRLHEAMRYSALDGGKRIRAILVYTAGHAVGAPDENLDAPACAVELIHAYSLVHDDLPAMDDDDLRRGKPSCHKAFDEATAILAGDALQSLAFYALSHGAGSEEDRHQRMLMMETLALASGSRGMAGGQAMDLAAEGQSLNLTELENMHIHKTGALIRASVKLGALARPGVDPRTLDRLDHYAKCIGLAFQIRDDVLDVEGETDTLGKPRGADAARSKVTYPSLMGLAPSKRMAEELHAEALSALGELGDAVEPLRWIADYIVERAH